MGASSFSIQDSTMLIQIPQGHPTTPGGGAGQLSSFGLHLSCHNNRKPQQMVFKESTGGTYRRVDMTCKSCIQG
jgi:hypothetical protein